MQMGWTEAQIVMAIRRFKLNTFHIMENSTIFKEFHSATLQCNAMVCLFSVMGLCNVYQFGTPR